MQKTHLYFVREIVDHQAQKESKVQLDLLETRAQTVVPDLTDKMVQQGEMVLQGNLGHQEIGAFLEQSDPQGLQDLVEVSEQKDLRVQMEEKGLWDQRVAAEALAFRVTKVIEANQDHKENVEKMAQEAHQYVVIPHAHILTCT